MELKKKTQLRDERIRQLEGNSRGLISNIRQQAERHVAELTNLREQMQVRIDYNRYLDIYVYICNVYICVIIRTVQILKQEHDYRLETMRQQEAQGGAVGSAGRAGGHGGRLLVPKSLRGGGGATRSFNWGDSSAMARSNSMSEEVDQNGSVVRGGAGGNYSKGASSQAMAVVTAEAVPVDYDDDEHPAAANAVQPPKPPSKSSVFSRMLKGQK